MNWRRLTLAVCAVLLGGCAGLRVPRIDPTGERVFVWPQNQATPVAPTLGTVQAQPVFTDPVFPQPTLTSGVVPASAPGVVQPGIAGAAVQGLNVPQDRLSITPDRVLAPVGSEVILRAGICTTENFLLTDQKVEWLIARESAGEIVDLGGKGCCRKPWLPWNKPKKIDNQYAIGYTAKMPLLITRGTADPSDDVKVERGHSWASITSPVEGTSHITAVTPVIESWAARRATAIIYWVDVRWTFPPSQITAGGSQVMTTTVRRHTDGTPLEGWIVRYEVAGGGGQLTGGQSGQVVEVVTGPDGRASIDVTPTGSTGSVTQINAQLVRPARLAGSDFPRLVVANGSSTINWTGQGSTPYLPEPDDLGGSFPTYSQPERGPPTVDQPAELATPVGRPTFDLQIRGDSQAQVNAQTRFEVVIRNQGSAPATGIVLHDRFDPGLSHEMDRRSQEIENTRVGSLAAGESLTIPLVFDVLGSGRLCHVVTIRCNEGAEATKQACIDAVQPAPQGQPGLEVKKDGPRQSRVDDIALFRVVIKNTGDVPLTNLEIVDEYDRSLSPLPTRQGYEIINDNIVWRVPRLEVGASETFEVQCTCLAVAERACGLVKVTDDSGLVLMDEKCVEVLPRLGSEAAAGVGPAFGGTLRLAIVAFSDSVRAGTRANYRFLIENKAQTPEQQVQLRVFFPAELTPDVIAMTNSANVRGTLVGNELRFDPIATVRPAERLEFLVPVSINKPGVVNITAQLTSQAVTTPVEKTERVEILGR